MFVSFHGIEGLEIAGSFKSIAVVTYGMKVSIDVFFYYLKVVTLKITNER